MITPEVLTYIQTERAKGTPDAVIKSNLLANGWNDADITQALAPTGSAAAVPAITGPALDAYRKKVLWSTFMMLAVIDLIIILISKLFLGSWGLFGISPLAILSRLLTIYCIASFTAHGSTTAKTSSRSIIVKAIVSTLVIILIIAGTFFFLCLFMFMRIN
jgi:hypothetical protein